MITIPKKLAIAILITIMAMAIINLSPIKASEVVGTLSVGALNSIEGSSVNGTIGGGVGGNSISGTVSGGGSSGSNSSGGGGSTSSGSISSPSGTVLGINSPLAVIPPGRVLGLMDETTPSLPNTGKGQIPNNDRWLQIILASIISASVIVLVSLLIARRMRTI